MLILNKKYQNYAVCSKFSTVKIMLYVVKSGNKIMLSTSKRVKLCYFSIDMLNLATLPRSLVNGGFLPKRLYIN